MSNEFKHKALPWDTKVNRKRWQAEDAHEADGETADDLIYFDGTYWKRTATLPATAEADIDHGTIAGLADDDHSQYLLVANIDDSPVNGQTAEPISSNWAFDHDADASVHHIKYTDANARSAVVSDTAYDATAWDGITTYAPSKNAVRDKIESLALMGAIEGTVADFQANAATGDFASTPQAINDNNTGTVAYADTVAQYAEVDYGKVISLNQFRLFGNVSHAGDGDWKVQYYNLATHAWVDWVTGITTRATADWGSWDSSGGEVITNKIRLVATTIDTCDGGADRNYCGEMEVKYA